MANLPCSASGEARLPHQHHGQLDRSSAGRKALGRLRCRTHHLTPRSAADGVLGPCPASCTRSARAFSEMSCRGMNGSIAPSRWMRLARDACTISARNRNRSASRPASQDGNRSLMRVHGPSRHQIDRRRPAWGCGLGPARIAGPFVRISTSGSSSVSASRCGLTACGARRQPHEWPSRARSLPSGRRLPPPIPARQAPRGNADELAQCVGPRSAAFPCLASPVFHLLQRPEALLDPIAKALGRSPCSRRARSPCRRSRARTASPEGG